MTRRDFLKHLPLLPLLALGGSENTSSVGFIDVREDPSACMNYQVINLRTGREIRDVVYADDIEGYYGQYLRKEDGCLFPEIVKRNAPIRIVRLT
jgi:hypothetical protein